MSKKAFWYLRNPPGDQFEPIRAWVWGGPSRMMETMKVVQREFGCPPEEIVDIAEHFLKPFTMLRADLVILANAKAMDRGESLNFSLPSDDGTFDVYGKVMVCGMADNGLASLPGDDLSRILRRPHIEFMNSKA